MDTTNIHSSEDLPDWREYVWRRVGCQRLDCPICGDFNLWLKKKKASRQDSIYGITAGIWEDEGEEGDENFAGELNFDDLEEPNPEDFPLYNKTYQWYLAFNQFIQADRDKGKKWILTEDGQNVSWYATLLLGKVFRQLTNRFDLDNGDTVAKFDYQDTKEIIRQSLAIWFDSYNKIIGFWKSDSAGQLKLFASQLKKLSARILVI